MLVYQRVPSFLRNNFWGKTSLVRRYMYDTFEEGTAPTVGAGNLNPNDGEPNSRPPGDSCPWIVVDFREGWTSKAKLLT